MPRSGHWSTTCRSRSGPQVVVNDERLSGLETGEDLYPWKRWHVSNPLLASSTEKPVDFFNSPSNAQELLAVFKAFYDLSDDVSAIPRYLSGNSPGGGAGRTASGLAMLMGNASKILQTVCANIDRDMMSPALTNLMDLILLTDTTGMLQGTETRDAQGCRRGHAARDHAGAPAGVPAAHRQPHRHGDHGPQRDALPCCATSRPLSACRARRSSVERGRTSAAAGAGPGKRRAGVAGKPESRGQEPRRRKASRVPVSDRRAVHRDRVVHRGLAVLHRSSKPQPGGESTKAQAPRTSTFVQRPESGQLLFVSVETEGDHHGPTESCAVPERWFALRCTAHKASAIRSPVWRRRKAPAQSQSGQEPDAGPPGAGFYSSGATNKDYAGTQKPGTSGPIKRVATPSGPKVARRRCSATWLTAVQGWSERRYWR